MSSYFVEYTAYIDERKRPEGFPHFVQIQETYSDVESAEHLKMIVNQRVTQLANNPGLVVFKNPDEPIDATGITFSKRRFIPWSMFTHMEMRVEIIPEPFKSSLDEMTADNPKKPLPEGYKN